MFVIISYTWLSVAWKFPWTCFWQECFIMFWIPVSLLHGNFHKNPFCRRIKKDYMDNSMYPFQCCFLYLNEYYMEISMDQFGETLKVLHGYFHVPVLIKNVWYCFVYVSEHCMYMENFTNCFETIFLSVNMYYMEISMYQFNLSNNDWYCFVCVK